MPYFMVLEGLDGAGTTTQARLLHDYLTHHGRDSFLTYEPTGHPIGALIRTLLDAGGQPPSQRVLGLLFAGDRLAHSEEIDHHLRAKRDVVCDRYIYSSLAYQTLDPSIDAEWVARVNDGCAVPRVTFFLEVPVDICLQRISARNDDRTIYERQDHLETIHRNYETLKSFYERRYGELVTIDGTLPPERVHAAIVAALP